MIKVYQTVRGKFGNCFAARIASIFELPIEEMPDYLEDIPDNPNWLNVWRAWLAERELGIFYKPCCCAECQPPRGYSILTLKWSDYPESHAAVCFDGDIMHDPVPGDLSPNPVKLHWYVFTVLDPAIRV